MHSILSKNIFFVKEKVKMFKASNAYEVFDGETKEKLFESCEENLGFLTKLFRFTDYKRLTPFNVVVRDLSGNQILRVERGFSIFRSKVTVFDSNDIACGMFRQRLLSIGGKFDFHDMQGNVLGTVKGKWTSWEFQFLQDGNEIAKVTKKWAGIGKEFFTSADNYALSISPTVKSNDNIRQLILAAVMCIDMVLKE